MKRRTALVAVLVVGAAWLGWLATPREPARPVAQATVVLEPEPVRGESDIAPVSEGRSSASVREEGDPNPDVAEAPRLRGRVIDESTGAPLPGCFVFGFVYGGEDWPELKTDAEGRFERVGPVTEGTRVDVFPPSGWIVEPSSLELDAAPREELVFRARALPAGPVHGRVVDELTLAPLPYATLLVGLEQLETDAGGDFYGSKPHPRGLLDFSVLSWRYALDWDPAREDPLVIPARTGPVFFLASKVPERTSALWLAGDWHGMHAFGNRGTRCVVEPGPPSRARFDWSERSRPIAGTLAIINLADHTCAFTTLAPERGTIASPLELQARAIGELIVQVQTDRSTEWYERIELALGRPGATEIGSDAAKVDQDGSGEDFFVVLEPGECLLTAELRGRVLARQLVTTRLGEPVFATLELTLPERREVESSAPATRVRGRVESSAGRPRECQLRFTRVQDGEEILANVHWTKSQGHWLGRFEDEGPAGEYRVVLEPDVAFAWSGPRSVTLPTDEELRFTLDDAVPVGDVYFVPRAAESGEALLAFEVDLSLEGRGSFEGEDFGSPSAPVATGHPRNVPFFWACKSAGRGAACGKWEPDGGTGDIRIEVPLARGWGAFLYVGGPNYEPLEGVRVFLDGVPAGATRPDGQICLAGMRPERITLSYRDWQIYDRDGGDVEPDGTFDDSETWMSASLAPPDR